MRATRPALAWPLTLLYAGTGTLKLVRTPEELHDDLGFAWAGTFPAWAVRAISSAEVGAAATLAANALTGRAGGLARLAIRGLALLQVGAIVTNVAHRDTRPLPVNLGALALAIAARRAGSPDGE